MDQNKNEIQNPVLLFDGVCNLCNGFVQFIIKHDKRKQFRFASLQSDAGVAAKKELGDRGPDSVILCYNHKYYTKSDAILLIFMLLGRLWMLGSVFYLMPRILRNTIYDWIALNRYKWLGKRDACMIPTPELKSRFLG